MWPPDPDPDPDPEPAGRSQPGAAVPGLRALLCSLKGRLLLAESVSAARPPPAGALGGTPRGLGGRGPLSRRTQPTPLRAPSSWANLPTFRSDLLKLRARDGGEAGLEPGPPRSSARECKAGGRRGA